MNRAPDVGQGFRDPDRGERTDPEKRVENGVGWGQKNKPGDEQDRTRDSGAVGGRGRKLDRWVDTPPPPPSAYRPSISGSAPGWAWASSADLALFPAQDPHPAHRCSRPRARPASFRNSSLWNCMVAAPAAGPPADPPARGPGRPRPGSRGPPRPGRPRSSARGGRRLRVRRPRGCH